MMMIFKVKITLLISLVIFLYSSQVSSQSPLSSSAKEVNSQQWVKEHFARGKVPPFSFVYGGKSSESFIKSWTYSVQKKKTTDPSIEESVFTYSEKQSGLVVKCFVTCFNDFHAV
jgi:alpha-galactosidase